MIFIFHFSLLFVLQSTNKSSFIKMSQMVSYLQDAVKATEDMSKYQFHSKKHSWYESRIASSKDMKWIEERETTMYV